MNNAKRTEAELEATIKYYKDLEDAWSVELNYADKKELAKAKVEYHRLLAQKEKEREAKKKDG